MIYLDHAATTPVPKAVADAMYTVLTEQYANPNAQYPFGQEMRRSVEDWRAVIAKAVGCEANQLFFTSCGTEGDNWAIRAACWQNRHVGRHIVTTAVEHHSVLAICKALENEGFEVVTVAPDESGHITPEAMAAACNEKTILASCMMVNSETGAIHDLPAIATACRRKSPNLIFHADCVQSFCRLPIEPAKWGIQLVSVSGHKIHAPKGTGALYIAKGTRLLSPLYGSGQEKGLRPGTENVPGIAALGLAAQSMNDRRAENLAHFTALRQRMITNLSQSPAVCINSPADAAPYIVNCSVQGIRSEVMIHYLEQFGIYVSSGSACAKGERSHVLTAMGLSRDRIDSAVRVSMTDTTTTGEIDEFCRRLLEGEATLTKRR